MSDLSVMVQAALLFVHDRVPFTCSYGQTGTGKTYTMEGDRSPEGGLSWEEVRGLTNVVIT